jgi:O-acetyl-ADP-ribose deacetylase (regulator of RNase III)
MSVLHQAVAWQFHALAVPPVGIGPGNLPFKDAAELLCDVLHSHLVAQAFPSRVQIVVETDEDKTVFDHLLRTRKL